MHSAILNKLCALFPQTDDKGVFSTSLTEEYVKAAETFSLSRRQIWDLSYNSITSIFAEKDVKDKLREKWKTYEIFDK